MYFQFSLLSFLNIRNIWVYFHLSFLVGNYNSRPDNGKGEKTTTQCQRKKAYIYVYTHSYIIIHPYFSVIQMWLVVSNWSTRNSRNLGSLSVIIKKIALSYVHVGTNWKWPFLNAGLDNTGDPLRSLVPPNEAQLVYTGAYHHAS